ncbi:MAG: RtcB family protein [Syntrophomonadaceae bacterium]|jgi:tRNA-splicing ligase RtcB
MFVIYNKKNQRVPIKVWLENINQIEEGCLQQAINLSNLPFLHKWVALMPDTHQGYGMPIGGVIAAEGVIIPNAVGVDIGCGMAFVETNIHKDEISIKEYQGLIGHIMQDIPTGFDHHAKKQKCKTLEQSEFAKAIKYKTMPEGLPQIEEGYYQIGTLGGGNHFIELQEDEEGILCIMIHSGSRNFGYKVARYYNNKAKELNKKWSSAVPIEYDLAFLPIDSETAKEYISWMTLALEFARENREVMLNVVKRHLLKIIPSIEFKNEVNAHHNYAAKEYHYGKNVWVHRKGAIRAREGETGIIPGAMGSYSYIVKGKGNPESFNSCSHGAGRKLGRRQAKKQFSVEKTIADLREKGVILGKDNKRDVSEESRFAYKDIDFVIGQELDLIEPIKKLKTIAVIKG